MYQENYDDEEFVGNIDVVADSYANVEEIDEAEMDEEELIMQAQAGVQTIPEQVRKFLGHLHRNLKNGNVNDLAYNYENQFVRLSEKFYAKGSWPEPQYVAALVGDDGLYYRHIYSRLHPSLETRFRSFENYCDLFNYILNSDGPIELELPNQWLWDIVDEFIYQFQSFCTHRSRVSKRTPEELALLKENSQVWNTYSVLNVLYSLIQKSNISQQLLVSQQGGDVVEAAGQFGVRPLYKMLGYFSIIGLVRTLENIELGNSRALFTRVTACHVTVYYYVGFAYLMMGRYADAIQTFVHILTFVSRTKQYQQRSFQFDTVNKKADQIPVRVDENIHTYLREKYGDQQHKMQRGGEEAIDVLSELYLFSCPNYQLKTFLREARLQLVVPTLRSFLKLYTTMGLDRLSTFLDMDAAELRNQLIVYKQRCRQIKWVGGADLLAGEPEDMIFIAESRVGRRYADWFIRNTNKVQDMINSLENRQKAVIADAGKPKVEEQATVAVSA
ncbi:RNA polymerase I-associated factor PAF67-domain-containing protein [Kickxella alabastrina]|uniref:RNA polymerase I-associated factor PAF67-domain-containing protein n=1 Tax=Kickxella alabastrina TaxID=61397 RepID=UPI00221F3217|nr:RNA polymerase I-associated factor PAF67-domain-containing protein [Kickxella alabastrina]KAI7827288.1 RNA polymerase I-associated factor PAF67-domain-containing protein [Kickxella alabastrina]